MRRISGMQLPAKSARIVTNPLMRRSLVFLACAVFSCARNEGWTPSRPGEIFRYTSVGRTPPLDSIWLGERWTSAAKYGARDDDTLFALPYGFFGGADAIGIHRDSLGVVTSIEFAYHPTRDVTALVADYRKSLGSPVVSMDTVRGVVRTITRWQDDATEFVIMSVEPPAKDGVAAMAFLCDRRRSPCPAHDAARRF